MSKKPATTKAAVAQLNLPLRQTVNFGLRIGPNRTNQTVDWIGTGAPIEHLLRQRGASWQAGRQASSKMALRNAWPIITASGAQEDRIRRLLDHVGDPGGSGSSIPPVDHALILVNDRERRSVTFIADQARSPAGRRSRARGLR